MAEANKQSIRVTVAADFEDALIQRLRDVSPRLQVEKHFPDVSESVWAETEVLYTIRAFPDPKQAPRLRWIQVHYAGVDGILNRPIVQAEDIEVTSASGLHAVQISEYCMGMMLAFMYKIPTMVKFQEQVKWPEKAHEIFRPHALHGLTLGIAGYGSIGRELARLAQAFGMKVLATKRDLIRTTDDEGYFVPGTGDPTGDIPERLYPPEALITMARDCDYLVMLTPLTNKTRHIVNEELLSAMKKTAVLINVSRGGVVDEAALISALAAQKIAGAALDVFEEEPLPATSPLWNLENVILSPHVSGNSSQYHQKAADIFIENLRRYVEGRPLLNRLNREHGY
ncbi:MAG: D-2-hydroxyacid dehydrogenase [Chitinophagaceae bacterium]|nr:D-2-hydroxyacid dehydrogenase [Anaerolineae bacterium]